MMWGRLPAWEQDDLPEPLPFSLRNAFRTIGPGAILLAGSIGGGEWLVGPAVAVKHGVGLMWIATIGIVLQTLFNLEAIRYTLYTGEPILSGIMRLRPGSRIWGVMYILLGAAQLGVPAVGAACATVLFAGFAGRLPGEADANSMLLITWGLVAVTVVLLLFGGTVERMLEKLSWAMIVFIFVFLVVVNVVFVPASNWGRTVTGFVSFGYVPENASLLLMATLAAMAGSGGIGNLGISNWVRDKGMGMGGRTGAIPSAIGSRQVQLSDTGKVFPLTGENLRRWRLWWKYVRIDQVWVWAVGCFLGMFLNVNLVTAIMPAGADITGPAAGAFQAQYMADHLWRGFWFLALLNGFWILYSTHLGNTDLVVRTTTDLLWTASGRVRQWPGSSIARLYYGLLLGFTVWGMIAVTWGHAMQLFMVFATVAGLILAIAAVQILIVNTRLLPKELQPSLWRRAALLVCAAFYGTFFAVAVADQIAE
jgi:hypothetical protein